MAEAIHYTVPKTTEEYVSYISEACQYIENTFGGKADIAVVLGSGLNNFTDHLSDKKEVSYHTIPHFPPTTVKGHQGKLVYGHINGKYVICLAGRSHSYEGYQMYELTFVSRVLALLGVKLLIATNASGGAQEGMYPGCLMVIEDHINFYNRNPLADTTPSGAFGERYPDCSHIYSERVDKLAVDCANKLNIKLFHGIYGSTSGPTYETPSEVQAFVKLGASCFGMSTIPETMTMSALGVEVFAVSLVTNLAAGLTNEVLTHAAVTNVAQESAPAFITFMKQFVQDVTVRPEVAKPKYHVTKATPLPQPQVRPATSQEIQEATKAVQQALGYDSSKPGSAVFLSKFHEDFLHQITDQKHVDLKNIPHFPNVSFNDGKFISGKSGNTTVVVVSSSEWEGFSAEDSNFLISVLHGLNIRSVVQTLCAGTVDEKQTKVGSLAFVTDVVDTTTVHPVPVQLSRDHTLPQYVASHPVSTKFHETAKSVDSTIVDAVYKHLPGPSFPTPAEISVARQTGSHLVGITTLAPVYASTALGIHATVLADVSHSSPSSFKLYKVHPNLFQVVHKVIQQSVESGKEVSLDQSVKLDQQIGYLLARPVTQGIFEHLEEAAEFVQKQFGQAADLTKVQKTAIVIDSRFSKNFLTSVKVLHEVAYSSLPHLKNLHGSLQLVEFQGKLVWVARGTGFVNQGIPASEANFQIRILGRLKVQKLLFVSAAYSTDASIHTGDLLSVADHIMLSGRNPLFGPNEERWGTRFPDAGEAYNKAFTLSVQKAATSFGLNLHSVVLGHFIGPLFASSADAKLASSLGMKAISTGLAQEVIVARHMKVEDEAMQSAAIGIVVAELNSTNSTEIPQSVFSQVESIAAKVI